MSGRILRRVRVAQTITSPALSLPARRCYAAFAATKVANPLHDHDSQPVAGPSHNGTAQSGTWQDMPLHDAAHPLTMEPPTQRNNRAPSLATSQSQVKSAFPNGVEEHLASVTAAGLAPTMSDLERCRPARYPYPRTPKYGEEYNAVVSTLCRCFSKAQLRGFLASWDVNTPLAGSKRKKVEYAESIIENMWGWPSLKEIQRAARDRTEVATKSRQQPARPFHFDLRSPCSFPRQCERDVSDSGQRHVRRQPDSRRRTDTLSL